MKSDYVVYIILLSKRKGAKVKYKNVCINCEAKYPMIQSSMYSWLFYEELKLLAFFLDFGYRYIRPFDIDKPALAGSDISTFWLRSLFI